MSKIKLSKALRLIIILAAIELVAAFFIIHTFHTWVFRKLYDWQELSGAAIGAATPILLFLWAEHRQEQRKRKDFLFLLEKSVVSAMNNLADVDHMLSNFLKINFTTYRRHVNEDDRAGRHSVGQMFIPLTSTFVMDQEMLKGTTGSTYLENLMMRIQSVSEELPLLIQDATRQLEATLTLNTQIGLMKANSATVHNAMLLSNLDAFEKMIRQQTMGHNIPIYLRFLAMTKIALEKMNKDGVGKWQEDFDYPENMSAEEKGLKMEEYFKDKVDALIDKLQPSFESRLLKMGAKSPYTGL